MNFQENRDFSRKAFCQGCGFSGLVGRWHKHVASPEPRPDHVVSLLALGSHFLPAVHPRPHMIHPAHQPPLCAEAMLVSLARLGSSYTITPLEVSARPAFPPQMYNSTNRIFLDQL